MLYLLVKQIRTAVHVVYCDWYTAYADTLLYWNIHLHTVCNRCTSSPLLLLLLLLLPSFKVCCFLHVALRILLRNAVCHASPPIFSVWVDLALICFILFFSSYAVRSISVATRAYNERMYLVISLFCFCLRCTRCFGYDAYCVFCIVWFFPEVFFHFRPTITKKKNDWKRKEIRFSAGKNCPHIVVPVSYTHLTLPTIYSV